MKERPNAVHILPTMMYIIPLKVAIKGESIAVKSANP